MSISTGPGDTQFIVTLYSLLNLEAHTLQMPSKAVFSASIHSLLRYTHSSSNPTYNYDRATADNT